MSWLRFREGFVARVSGFMKSICGLWNYIMFSLMSCKVSGCLKVANPSFGVLRLAKAILGPV